MKRKDTSKLLDNALDILIYLQKNGLRGIREISNDLNISKSSVQRIINTFMKDTLLYKMKIQVNIS